MHEEMARERARAMVSPASGEMVATVPGNGAPVAAAPGFDYSPAMKRFATRSPRWTRDLIDRYAADPEALVPGTSMAFHGMPDAQERKALIDYLEGLGG